MATAVASNKYSLLRKTFRITVISSVSDIVNIPRNRAAVKIPIVILLFDTSNNIMIETTKATIEVIEDKYNYPP